MDGGEREFQRVRWRDWVIGCWCLETKLGFILVVLGGVLLWWTDWRLPGLG